ncbi:MAG: MFS family permease [Cryomorphaceae bacterium]|jgi:MFS family permease
MNDDTLKDSKPIKGAHLGLILLIFLNILNMVDRSLIASFGTEISHDLDLTDTQFGLLVGPMFVFFYAIMGLFVGRMADMVHRPKLIAVGVLVWSVLTAVSGAARSFLHIGLARMFVGVGESCLSPAAMSMLSDMFPPAKRGMASGLYYLGLPLGAGASYIIAAELGPVLGWRNCFYVLGGLGLLLVPAILLLRDPQRGRFDNPEQKDRVDSTGVIDSMRQVLTVAKKTPALAWAMIGAVFMHLPLGSGQFVQIWLVRERGYDASGMALFGLLFIVFGIIGIVIGGLASDWYIKHFKGGRLRFLAIFLLIITPFFISFRFVSPDSPLFYVGMCAGFLSLTAFYGPVFSTVQDLSPTKLRGATTAVLLLMCNLVGIGLGGLATGVLSDFYSGQGVLEPLTLALLSIDLVGILTITSFFIGSVHWQRQFGRS